MRGALHCFLAGTVLIIVSLTSALVQGQPAPDSGEQPPTPEPPVFVLELESPQEAGSVDEPAVQVIEVGEEETETESVSPAPPAPTPLSPVPPKPPEEVPQPPTDVAPVEERPVEDHAPGPESGRKRENPREESSGDAKTHKFDDFVKGELLTLGRTDLLGDRSRAGVSLGYRAIGQTHYGTVEPGVDLRYRKFHLGLAVPLNIEVWDGSEGLTEVDVSLEGADVNVIGFENAGSLRYEDWDSWRDFFRILQHAGWGRKEDFLYVNISQGGGASIGHGLIMKRYLPTVDLDTPRVGIEMDAYLDWLGGFEFYVNDMTRWSMVGTLLFLKPLGPFIDSWQARSFSIGFSFVTDMEAPVTLATENGRIALDNSLNRTLPLAQSTTTASIWGIDTELKVVKTKKADVKLYFDYSKMVDAGSGGAIGALGRFNAGTETVHAFRTRIEGRLFSGNYEPSYFDSFYEIDRWQFMSGPNVYGTGGDPTAAIRTKYDVVTSRPDDRQYGYFVEGTYSILGKFSIGGALEGQQPNDSYHLLLHADVPALDMLRIRATYQKRHFSEFGRAFDFTEDNEWLSAMARVQLLPILFINAQVGHLWRLNRREYTGESSKGQPGPDYGLYQAGWDFRFWLDASFEW
jgi:hypothetical protein